MGTGTLIAWAGKSFSEVRWYAEAARLFVDPVWAGDGIPRGSGQPLVLLPGFLVGDWSLNLLDTWLHRIGYDTHRLGTRFNVDCSARALDSVERAVQSVSDQAQRRVRIVGHSRGGILGRGLAARRPDLVEQVIALGSGLANGYDVSPPIRAAVHVVRSYHAVTTDRETRYGCMTESCRCDFGEAVRAPFPDSVELVSIYSKGDGVSHWRSSRVPYAHNVEVTGSHVGLVVNRKAYRAIAVALAGVAAGGSA